MREDEIDTILDFLSGWMDAKIADATHTNDDDGDYIPREIVERKILKEHLMDNYGDTDANNG